MGGVGGGGIPDASLRSLLRLNRRGGVKKGDGLDGKNDIQAGEDKERKREQAVQIHAGLRNH